MHTNSFYKHRPSKQIFFILPSSNCHFAMSDLWQVKVRIHWNNNIRVYIFEKSIISKAYKHMQLE